MTIQCAQPTLVVIADDNEAVDLVGEATPYWTNPATAESGNPQRAWRFDNVVVLVTGSGGPAIVALCARWLREAETAGSPFGQVVNFGSCGRYSWSAGTAMAEAYFTDRSRQWDLSFNFRGWEYFNATLFLDLPPQAPTAGMFCFSGNRYSDQFDRSTPQFLEGDLEEYELYALAWLCESLQVPLVGLKFVTDTLGGSAVGQKQQNLEKARKRGTEVLLEFLAGSYGFPTRAPWHASLDSDGSSSK